ncbi:peptidoglycan D,D-transpeptidase FtsI family protein [Sphingomonas quercus]|uniref:Penicillin-binding protein 2 n=1 Tax=Sphingomonas quercus TaxID=2842451 RepID=A0ABS6BHJ6_9SPHN|nr:penicillin-binding protein 2 [Sphingomonas quercus]MBU3077776.1 penicillin-binding protein 2 [Sphingomonas quercus]
MASLAQTGRVTLAGQRHQTLQVAHYRLMVMMLLFLGLSGIVALRLTWLAVFTDAPSRGTDPNALLPPRGDIVDRNGVPLAVTIRAWSIALHPDRVDPVNRVEVAEKLARVLPEKSAAQYLAILQSGKSFVYLRRRALPATVEQVNAIGSTAIELTREPERLYPQTGLASHVLGFVGRDGIGMSGMERVLDHELTDPLTRGKPAMLSIDSRVQAAVEGELAAAMAKHSAIGAAGLVLDVRTGEVLAMASLPTYNPNAAGRGDPEALRNNVTQSVYELGSTFKAITIANAIENGVVTSMTQKYDATAPLQIGRYRIKDDHPENRWLNVPEMMVHSSNIVTARISEQIGEERIKAMFTKLGFDTPPAIELVEKGRPLWPVYWGRSAVMTVGYGHGIAVTPLHLASAYAALVNGGTLRPATLLKRDAAHVPEGRKVISEATSFRVRQLLRMVVIPEADGTGKSADTPGFRLGGKTGTAEKPRAGGGGYDGSNNVATFAGVFPMDEPRYVIIMMLDSPKGTKDTYGFKTAGWTIAPAVKKVLGRVGPMLGVTPDQGRDIDLTELLPLVWHPGQPPVPGAAAPLAAPPASLAAGGQ